MNKIMKCSMFLLSILLLFTMAIPRLTSAAMVEDGRDLLLMINGNYIHNTHPVYKEGRILIPLRDISDELGATTQFTSAKKPIVIKFGKNTLQFTLNQKQALVNGKVVKLDVPAQSIRNTTYVPVRLVATGLGVDIEVDEITKVVSVEAKQQAGQTKLTEQRAKAIVQKELERGVSLKSWGVKYLHFYEFQAYNEYHEYDFSYLVDKYTGELYMWQFDRSIENLTRNHVKESVQAKLEPVTSNAIRSSLELWDYDDIKMIKGKKYYAFDACYVGAQNPFYYITTIYVGVDGKISYMENAKIKMIDFSENGFKELAKKAFKELST